MGYEWHPIVRISPQNGSDSVLDLRSAMTDAAGPGRVQLRYIDLALEREDVNRGAVRIERGGFRPQVRMDFDVLTMADQRHLAQIVTAGLRGDRIFLSLDGGLVEREMVLMEVPEPVALAGKTVVGANLRLALRAVDPVDELPLMTQDPPVYAELLANGNFDSWATATDADDWTETITNGTVNRDAATVRAGAFAARLDKSVASLGGLSLTSVPVVLVPGRWYELQVSARADFTDVDAAQWRLGNLTNTRGLQADGSWALPVPGKQRVELPLTADVWSDYVIRFRVDPDFGVGDEYQLILHHYEDASGNSVWFDRVRLFGPVLATGGATW